MTGLVLLACGATVLVLFTGYCYGRWETEAHYEPIVDELEQTIASLLRTEIKVLP